MVVKALKSQCVADCQKLNGDSKSHPQDYAIGGLWHPGRNINLRCLGGQWCWYVVGSFLSQVPHPQGKLLPG